MTVTVACSAMAARTMLDEKGLPTGKIGHSGWSERDRIGFEQIAGETMGKIRNLAWSAFGGNDRLKPCRPLYKLGAFRRWWQRGETCGDRGSELGPLRSEEHTSEIQSLMRLSYAVSCLK